MDCRMPNMDGLEATREIRLREGEQRRQNEGRIPIIAISANAFPEDRDQCFAAGMDAFLAKPYSGVQLGQAIQETVLRRLTGRAVAARAASSPSDGGDVAS
jgi:CheY-like chemotaxis protein